MQPGGLVPRLSVARRLFGGVPRNVLFLSVVSFFADVSGEMIYPFIPIFLTTVLGAPVAAVGLIEGIAESTASLTKIASGTWSDRLSRRLPFIVFGYGAAAVAKLLLAVAVAWPMALAARTLDRFGKGVRGSPRDALIADSTVPEHRGRAFGFHRSLDTAGAVVGPLVALVLAAAFHDQLRWVFAIAVIPGVLSVAALALVHESKPSQQAGAVKPPTTRASIRALDRRLQLFLAASLLFALGNSSDIFLILRAKDLGLSTTAVVLAYALYNFTYMAVSFPAGIVSDRSGRRNVFLLGLAIFAFVYLGFALANDRWQVWPLFLVYGLYIGLTDGVSKALITDLAPADRRATALGAYGMITGLGALVASVVAGLLWDSVDSTAPFVLGSIMAVLSAFVVLTLPARFHGGTAQAGKA